MSSCLTSDSSRAVPITPLTKGSLPQWLEAHPERREWLNLIGFKAEPNSFAFLPSSEGDPTRVLAGAAKASRYGRSRLCRVAARRRLLDRRRARPTRTPATAAARLVARFVCLHEVQGAEACSRDVSVAATCRSSRRASASAQGVFLARDLINTPTEDMGPDQLIEAGAAIARHAGANVRDPARRRAARAELSDHPRSGTRQHARAGPARLHLGR